MPPLESRDYNNILLQNSSLLDVRSPLEFTQGTVPGAKNIPILNDQERHIIGVYYKQNGQEQAIQLGHQLIQGKVKDRRIEAWLTHVRQENTKYLYCFRGGLRSKITQQWLQEAGLAITRIEGGYKALRRHLINVIATADQTFNFILTGGLTGCRKTELIKQLANGLDLEGAAYHRGSSFGAHALPQSTQASFENNIGAALIKACNAKHNVLSLEDEGKFIGSVDLPKNIYEQMRISPLVVVERSVEDRLQELIQEYIVDMLNEYSLLHSDPEQAFNAFSEYLLASLQRIKKRLGVQRWQECNDQMIIALDIHRQHMDPQAHLNWLSPLIEKYYDPMYTSQLKERADRIVFRGDFQACKQYLNHYADTFKN